MQMYPLKFRPIYKERIWGGQKLREVFGKDLPNGVKVGESWELADLPDDKSIIANGALAGQSLKAAIEKYPKGITGDENFSGDFPLLIKLLDAEDVLSVQVHPDRQTCRRMGKGDPKTECWYVISSEPGAVIYKGLKQGVSREAFAEAINDGNVDKLLTRIEVEPGQCHFLPAGTAHAIGAGLVIAEIQMPSDTTYRVFDWNRVDAASKGRALHIEEALESIHFGRSADELSVTTAGRLVDSEYFKIDEGHHAEGEEVLIAGGEMKVLIILAGFGTIAGGDGISVGFNAGDTLLIPAAYEGAMVFGDNSQYLTVRI